ncbi:MAG TPA: ATP-binding protein [Thermoanaerobaculia bacterium]|nr:ATP-binding protein [Thermoanaerobaculia bacterium]
MGIPHDEEEDLRSVALQNSRSILLARQRAEEDLLAAKEALEARTAELEEANALIRTIAENAASCLLMLDERGVATYVNPAATEATGYAPEDFASAPFHDILHADAGRGGHALEECPIRDARERLIPLKKYRDLFVRKDGSAFPVSCALSPLKRDGSPAGAVLEFRDITDELVAQKALEESNRRKDEFLATLSHELRTPMTAILGWAKLLKMGLSESETRHAIHAIESSAEVQAQLIEDVLDVSRTAAGKMTFVPVAVDLGPVVNAAMTTVHPAAAAKGIEMLASIPPRIPQVLGDDGRLQQIVWNLLANAVKFTPRGGTITLRLTFNASLVRLTIQDTGKGISPDYLPRVFEPFSQEDGTTTRAHEGVGLGLSIVRSLVELHGGRIRAWSEGPGRGATFTLDLPVMESTVGVRSVPTRSGAVAMPVDEEGELPRMPGMRILVIDDQQHTRDVLGAIFRRAEATIEIASSVREGLERFRETSPAVVLCDLAMPVEDGYVFLSAVRASEGPAASTPIIALTAFGRPEDRRRALSAGFDEYLKKPVDPTELVATAIRLARR